MVQRGPAQAQSLFHCPLSYRRWKKKSKLVLLNLLRAGRAERRLDDAIGGKHTGDGRRGEGGNDASNEGRDGELRDVTGTGGGELGQDTDLGTERTNVTETL